MILDAAEKAFAHRGYHGTTIREVFKDAGLNSGLMSYYFGSKDDMFTGVVDRRYAEMKDCFLAIFDSPRSPCDDDDALEKCLALYLKFFFKTAFSSHSTLRYYILLLANAASVFDDTLVADLLKRFDYITERMIIELSTAMPGVSEAALREGMFYLESAVTTIMLTERFRQTRLAHLGPAELETLWNSMAVFFAKGMRGHASAS